MLPFQIDPSWYERRWYGKPAAAKRRWLPTLIRVRARLTASGRARPLARETAALVASRLDEGLS
jgi:hypothetical protein